MSIVAPEMQELSSVVTLANSLKNQPSVAKAIVVGQVINDLDQDGRDRFDGNLATKQSNAAKLEYERNKLIVAFEKAEAEIKIQQLQQQAAVNQQVAEAEGQLRIAELKQRTLQTELENQRLQNKIREGRTSPVTAEEPEYQLAP